MFGSSDAISFAMPASVWRSSAASIAALCADGLGRLVSASNSALRASIRSAAASIRPRVTNSASSHSAPSASCLSRHLEVVTLAVPVPARAGDTRRAHVEPEFLHAEQGLTVVQRPVLIRGLYGLGARRVGAARRADLVKEPFNAGLGVVAVIRGGRVDRVGGVPPVGEHLAGALDDPWQDGRALVTHQ